MSFESVRNQPGKDWKYCENYREEISCLHLNLLKLKRQNVTAKRNYNIEYRKIDDSRLKPCILCSYKPNSFFHSIGRNANRLYNIYCIIAGKQNCWMVPAASSLSHIFQFTEWVLFRIRLSSISVAEENRRPPLKCLPVVNITEENIKNDNQYYLDRLPLHQLLCLKYF